MNGEIASARRFTLLLRCRK